MQSRDFVDLLGQVAMQMASRFVIIRNSFLIDNGFGAFFQMRYRAEAGLG